MNGAVTGFRVLALSAASGRVGYVFFIDGQLVDWGLSAKASRSPALAADQATTWIAAFSPDVVVNEQLGLNSRKGVNTKQLIAAMIRVASDAHLNDVAVPRVQTYPNKYAEAAALAKQFPDLAPWMPKRPPIWIGEPRNMILFEALALALLVIEPPST